MERKKAKIKKEIFWKDNCAITLVALIITIIVLLILAGITMNLVLGERGIFKYSQEAIEQTKQAEAKQKLELVLLELQAQKVTDETYNENEYIDKKINASQMTIIGDIVFVDGYQFQIDRSVPEIGKGEQIETINIISKVENAKDFTKAIIKIEIEYEGEITNIQINGEHIEVPQKTDGKYVIQKEVFENGNYSIYVKDSNKRYKIEQVSVTEISTDMNIYTPEQLVEFRDRVNKGATYQGKTVQLMNKIDLSNVCYKVDNTIQNDVSWVPIGTTTNRFYGTFNGNDYSIENLYINTTNNYQSLFSYNNGTIKRLNLGNGKVIGNEYIAGLVSINHGKVIRCSNLATSVTAKNATISGGLIAQNSNLVEECYNKAPVTVQGSSGEMQVGGVVGGNYKHLYSSYNAGEVIGIMTGDKHINVGGVIGYNSGGASIAEGLYNTGKITAQKATEGISSIRIGGVCGTVFPQNATLRYAYNIGSVSASSLSKVYLGDVLGDADRGTAQYLYSNGKKIIGEQVNNAIVSNCYTTIPQNIDSKYFISDNNGINQGFPILKWQTSL